METYINDPLVAGIIRPLSSPAGAGFFFMEKKDKNLIPCIDYRGLKQQRFLGFANFYQRFILDNSTLLAPLTALTSPKVAFSWNPSASRAFETLKAHFITAPIVQLPDPDRQFVVEVDASDIGVGAVLSQCSASDQKLHSCAFFSRQLNPAKQNYDIGNQELLAVKLALEEWRHWLEGTKVHQSGVFGSRRNTPCLSEGDALCKV